MFLLIFSHQQFREFIKNTEGPILNATKLFFTFTIFFLICGDLMTKPSTS
jgi:hypothetical protein